MSVKLSKKEQLQYIEQLRYGRNWPQVKQSLLDYEYTLNSQQYPFEYQSKRITYELLGRKNQHFITSQKIVQKKVTQFLPFCQQQLIYQFPKPKRLKRYPQSEQFYDRQQRYYNNEILCKYCSQSGHTSQFCPVQKKCLYCLCSTHTGQNCGHKNICFDCYELKHSTETCEQKQIRVYCTNCERKHMKYDSKTYCYSLTKNREEKKQLFPTDQFYNCYEILCVRCRRHGHLFCPQYIP